MGAGKSTIGRRLAKKLKRHFFDTDQEIEKRTGARIALIFEIEGEARFRRRESEMLEELTKHSDIVLATGGGAVLDPGNRKILGERGLVVYLRTGVRQLFRRTGKDRKRPLLDTDDPEKKISELLETRAPLYEQTADLIIDTDQQPMQKILEKICKYGMKQNEGD